jgi:hypothetical protein
VKNRTLFAWGLAILALLCCLEPLAAADRQIVVGREDRWEEFPRVENLVLTKGRWGTLDLGLRDNRYAVTAQTDLLLHFDAPPVRDETGRYAVEGQDPLLSDRFFVLGGGSAAFTNNRGPLRLIPGPDSLFAPSTWVGDFSIEFWLQPALLDDGEEVFAWRGARWRGAQSVPQEIRCTVLGRRLIWSFENLFMAVTAEPTRVTLEGITPLVPRDWHHHLLRYDSTTGLLEYLVDGVPEAVTYTTDTGGERGSLWVPYVGEARRGSVQIGSSLTGFLDELRILRGFVEAPAIARYGDTAGTAVSRPFDLGYTGTRLKRIEATVRTPGDSTVFFYFRIYDRIDDQTAAWRQFLPGQVFDDARGRYLQLRVELYPDGARENSPEVSELRAVYEQDLPPAPPSGLQAVAGSGTVQLYWKPVNEADVRGYLVYYGDGPGNYHGSDSDRGRSPIDVGKVSEFQVTGLNNGKLYYFSVVAYDATEPPHRSLFAREASARPSAVLPTDPGITLGPGPPRVVP